MLRDDNNLCKVITCCTWVQSLQRLGAAPVAASSGRFLLWHRCTSMSQDEDIWARMDKLSAGRLVLR